MKNQFEKIRQTEMSEQEFSVLVLTYPIFAVAMADGSFDRQEREFMSTIITNFLEPIYKDKISESEFNSLIENYIDDFEFLSNHMELKDGFIAEFNQFNNEVKESILNLISEVAEVSGGTSDVEQDEIDYIKSKILM